MREYLVGLRGVAHVLLNSKIVNAQVKVQRCGHAHRAHVRCPMRSCPHLIHFGQAGNFLHLREAAGMNDRGANIVDQLLLNELLAIEDAVEHFAHGQRRRRMPANQAETFLQFRWCRVLQPKEVIRFEFLA